MLGFRLGVVSKGEGDKIDCQCKGFSIVNPNSKLCPDIFSIQENEIPLDIHIEVPSKNSPQRKV